MLKHKILYHKKSKQKKRGTFNGATFFYACQKNLAKAKDFTAIARIIYWINDDLLYFERDKLFFVNDFIVYEKTKANNGVFAKIREKI